MKERLHHYDNHLQKQDGDTQGFMSAKGANA
jgi:hypothetical protein